MKRKMKSLDLFSGIGGFALALEHVAEPMAFCENDENCTKLLSRAFPGVPVFPDVTRLSERDVSKLGTPDVITAGFPCQDISCLRISKDAQGIHGPRSRLFFEIPRLIAQLPSIKHVFLENSPCIHDRGLDEVMRALKEVGMTHFAHGVFAASSLGAPHSRRRWFCLASRAPHPTSMKTMSVSDLHAALRNRWNSLEIVRRLLPRSPIHHAQYALSRKRLSLLGNAIVPQCGAYAYQTLATCLLDHAKPKANSIPITHCKSSVPLYKRITLGVHDASFFDIERPELLPQRDNQRLTIYLEDDEGNHATRKMWRTPTSGEASWNQSRRMTDRALWNLGNMIFYAKDSRCPSSPTVSDRSNHCMINPVFVERMMGYKDDWTLISAL